MNSKINGVTGGPPRIDGNKPAGEAESANAGREIGHDGH